MQFREIVGQHELKKQLTNLVQHKRLPHASLLLGATGRGGLPIALALAQFLHCEQPQTDDSCGVCPNCRKHAKFFHPDLHFSFPSVGSKATSTQFLAQWRKLLAENPYFNAQQWLQAIGEENQQGNITKDECTEIVKKLSLKGFENDHKILLMWLPEYLGKEGNRLLKMIEEPPDDTLFLLVAENPDLILNTIMSRCQLIRIAPIDDKALTHKLVEEGVAEELAHTLVAIADGDYNQARQLLVDAEKNFASLFLEWMRLAWKAEAGDVIAWAEKFAELGREGQKHFFKYGLFFLRELLVIKTNGNMQPRLQGEILKAANNMSKIMDYYHIEKINNLINENVYYIERNANAKILMTDLTLELHRTLKIKAKVV